MKKIGRKIDPRLREDVGVVEGNSESLLFNPYKNVGLVSTGVPCLLRYIHKRRENFIITCTGKALATYVVSWGNWA